MKGRVLIIAGSDPSGGAGLQADIKTVTALGGYAAAAVTAVTVQNTRGVSVIHPIPPDIIRDQIIAVLDDIGADAIKIGMIGGADAGRAILDGLEAAGWDYDGGQFGDTAPLVLDPVLAATSGDNLSTEGLADFLKTEMLPQSYLVTPNIPEAESLTGIAIGSIEDQKNAGEELLDLGVEAALIKGGHLSGDDVVDYLATRAGDLEFCNPRIDTTSTHGTGCTLASAIATGLAQGMAIDAAVRRAIAYVRAAIRTAPGFGEGCGPLNHAHGVDERQ